MEVSVLGVAQVRVLEGRVRGRRGLGRGWVNWVGWGEGGIRGWMSRRWGLGETRVLGVMVVGLVVQSWVLRWGGQVGRGVAMAVAREAARIGRVNNRMVVVGGRHLVGGGIWWGEAFGKWRFLRWQCGLSGSLAGV